MLYQHYSSKHRTQLCFTNIIRVNTGHSYALPTLFEETPDTVMLYQHYSSKHRTQLCFTNIIRGTQLCFTEKHRTQLCFTNIIRVNTGHSYALPTLFE